MDGSWTWILLDVIGVLALGAIIAYGILITHRRRSQSAERMRDEATKRMYEERSQDRAV